MTILAIDGMNMFHRARSGFKLGPAPVVFNFFRQLRALIDQFQPTRVYLGLEGRPVRRHETLSEYKANRVISPDDPRAEEMSKFFAQKDIIVNLLVKYFPVAVVRHPTSECDDTLANLARRSSTAVPWIIASSDTDFIQLLQTCPHVRLYNPVTKSFVDPPSDYSYLTWKALRGDPTDNIPGVPGIGDKTAAKIASDPDALREYLSRSDVGQIFTRNYDLINFVEWSEEDRSEMTSSSPNRDWDAVRQVFSDYGFSSIVNDESWSKFIVTFDKLWNI